MAHDPVRTVFTRLALVRSLLGLVALVAMFLPWNTWGDLLGDFGSDRLSWIIRLVFSCGGPLIIAVASLGVVAYLKRTPSRSVSAPAAFGLWIADIGWQVLPLLAWVVIPHMISGPGCGNPPPNLPALEARVGQMLSVGGCAACVLLVLAVEPFLLTLSLRSRRRAEDAIPVAR